jgi:hypothetical protein
MLLRLKDPDCQYQLPLPEDVVISRDCLWTALAEDNNIAIENAINDLLFRLWTRAWKKTTLETRPFVYLL